jgi:type IV pilus assembly protein PilP
MKLAVVLVLAVAGCEDPVRVGPTAPSPSESSGATPAGGGESAALRPERPLSYHDEDFVESEMANRDPFRAAPPTKQPPIRPDRAIVMPHVPIDQMRVVALVTGLAQPRAMITDPAGVGFVVTRGDFVGQTEVIQTGGVDGIPVQLNWRVERIRDDEVVLVREDPTAPGRPPLTRVLPLRQDGDLTAMAGGVTPRD